jgi:hypothetical protein
MQQCVQHFVSCTLQLQFHSPAESPQPGCCTCASGAMIYILIVVQPAHATEVAQLATPPDGTLLHLLQFAPMPCCSSAAVLAMCIQPCSSVQGQGHVSGHGQQQRCHSFDGTGCFDIGPLSCGVMCTGQAARSCMYFSRCCAASCQHRHQ